MKFIWLSYTLFLIAPGLIKSTAKRKLHNNHVRYLPLRLVSLVIVISHCLIASVASIYLSIHLSIYLSIYPSIYLSIHLSIYLSIYGCTVLLLDLGRFSSFFIYTQSAGLLASRHIHTGQHKNRINAHPCLEWDSNPRSQSSSERRQYIP
jgi:hypothetical protein